MKVIMDTFINFLEIYGSVSATLKYGLKKIPSVNAICENSIFNVLLTISCWILSIPVIGILSIVLTTLFLYKLLVTFILQKRHGKNFAGMLKSADNMWAVEDENAYCIINTLIIFEFDKTKGDLMEMIKDRMCTNGLFKSRRSRCVRKSFMGYEYFLDEDLSADEIVSSVRVSDNGKCTQNDLVRFISKYANTPLPLKNKASCQLIVCEDRVCLNGNNDDKEEYAILFRAHHAVGDGITFMNVITTYIDDSPKEEDKQKEKINKLIKKSFGFYFKQILWKCYKCESYVNTLFTPHDENILKTSTLSPEKIAVFKIEPHTGLMEKIKAIKNVFKTTFSCVVYAAICKSLHNFFKNDKPETFTTTFTVLTPKAMLNYQPGELKNVFSIGNIRLPIKDATFPDMIRLVTKEQEKYVNSCDSWIYEWQLKTFCNVFPNFLLRLLVRNSAITTAAFSNLPGINKFYVGRYPANHMVFFVPSFVTAGIGFSMSTYDGRLQMGLMVDKNIIAQEKQAQKIIDDIYLNIDKMYEIITK